MGATHGVHGDKDVRRKTQEGRGKTQDVRRKTQEGRGVASPVLPLPSHLFGVAFLPLASPLSPFWGGLLTSHLSPLTFLRLNQF